MSRPRHYWYGMVKSMIYRYPVLSENVPMEKMYLEAINSTLEEVGESYNGDDKKIAISMICFERRYTLDGVAQKMNYGHNTIQRWVNSFVNAVGKKVGY